MFLQDPYLNEITCTDPFGLKIYRVQEIVMLKQQNSKSVTNPTIWVKLI